MGEKRWYKAYLDEGEILNNRNKMLVFLKDDNRYNQCITEIYEIIAKMEKIQFLYEGRSLADKFKIYCDVLCEYISYYNSVIADAFYQNVYDLVDECIPREISFRANIIKDSLFATDNNNLLSHTQNVDIVELSKKYYKGQNIEKDVIEYVSKYKSVTSSSANPNGISKEEVMDLVKNKSVEELETLYSFFNNLKLRYDNAENWSKYTAGSIGLSEELVKIIRRTSQLSYLKILMREKFQDFKISTREIFLSDLIGKIGKQHFDYMLINEIEEYILSGNKINEDTVEMRKHNIIFEVEADALRVLYEIPNYVEIESKNTKDILSGDVLIGSGIERYTVRIINQDEEGLSDFNNYIEKAKNKSNIALITNVLRPFLVPKLKKFGVLLTQYGGYTSHASVLCREMGINSIIGIDGLMDSLANDECIEIDYSKGEIKKVNDTNAEKVEVEGVGIDLKSNYVCNKRDVGNKAFNLIRINTIANIPRGFVLSCNAMRNIGNLDVKNEIMNKVALLKCEKLAIRSSHESEDGDNATCAGLFESYVNVDAKDENKIIGCINKVYNSQYAEHLDKYGVNKEGDMHVIIQEMISADISGVMLTSSPHYGFDYLLVEYARGDLCHIMQGDITPFSSFIRKDDILNGKDEYRCYPEFITRDVKSQFLPLFNTALKLEEEFLHRVEIEWGIRDGEIYIFQVRTY